MFIIFKFLIDYKLFIIYFFFATSFLISFISSSVSLFLLAFNFFNCSIRFRLLESHSTNLLSFSMVSSSFFLQRQKTLNVAKIVKIVFSFKVINAVFYGFFLYPYKTAKNQLIIQIDKANLLALKSFLKSLQIYL